MADISVSIQDGAVIRTSIVEETAAVNATISQEETPIKVTISSTGPRGERGEGIPDVTSADNGKILRVVNGEWNIANFYSMAANEAGGNTLTL